MGKKTVETTASGLNQFIGKQGLAPLDTEEVTELGQYFPSSGGDSGFEPTEAQLEAMNSGITAAKVAAYDTLPDEDDVKDLISDHFVAGTNVTITDNVDGTQTISSTASGGTSDYSDLTNKPTINNVTLSGNKTTADLGISEVPTVTASDDRKFLKALYDSSDVNYEWADLNVMEVPNPTSGDNGKVLTATGLGTYAWATPSSTAPLTGSQIIPNNQGERIDHFYYGTPVNVGLVDDFALYTETNQVQTSGWRLATAIGSNHKLYFKFKPYSESWGSWIALDIDALSNYSAAPTAYTTPTLGTHVTDVSGGYVVSNNICTINICFKMSSHTAGEVVFSGLPVPALKPGSSDNVISTVLTLGSLSNSSSGKSAIHVYLTQGGSIVLSDEAWTNLGGSSKLISGSYLVDPSWSPT